MKSFSLSIVGLAGCLLTATENASGQNGADRKPVAAKARPTHGQLSERREAVQSDGRISLVEDPQRRKTIESGKSESLIERSAILSHQDQWTIVPKESVLHVPENLRERVNGKRSGKLVVWREFLAANRTWLQLQEVSLAQARGEAALSEEETRVYKSTGRVVIAVCHEGPISVKPAREGGVLPGTRRK